MRFLRGQPLVLGAVAALIAALVLTALGQTTAVSVLAIVAIGLRPTWRRSVLIAGAVGIAVAVGASRSLLGVHWFSDVVGGLILGWAWCLICAVLYDVLKRRPVPSGSTSTVTSSPSAT